MNRTVTVKQEHIPRHEPQMGLDIKTDWLTDRQSQCDFDFDYLSELGESLEMAVEGDSKEIAKKNRTSLCKENFICAAVTVRLV
jgi:hypothetical protein